MDLIRWGLEAAASGPLKGGCSYQPQAGRKGWCLKKGCPLGSSVSKWYNLSIKMSTGVKKPKPIGFGAGIEA